MKNILFVLILILFILFSSIWLTVFGQTLTLDLNRFNQYSDSMLQKGIAEKWTPGVVAAVVSRDTIIYLKGFGVGNVESKSTIDPASSIFQIGSVGKIFTVISVLQQIDKNKLDLNVDVGTYAPEIPIDNNFEQSITLQNLLTHTAGLDDRFIGYAARSVEEIRPLGHHLKERFPHRFTEPGIEISYSNYGYALAGYLVEKASRKNFTTYVEDNVLSPTGMKSSGYFKKMQQDPYKSQVVTGYSWGDKGFEKVTNFQRHPIPAGGMYTTAKDMSRFMQMILNKGFLDDKVIYDSTWQNQLTSRQFSNHPWLTGYTLGFEEQNFNGVYAIAKGGSVPGFASEIVLFPNDGLGIFLVTNVSQDALLEEYMNGFVKKFIKGKNLYPAANQSFPVDDYTGSYRINRHNRHDIEDIFELFQGQIHITSPEEGVLQLFHDGDFHHYKAINDTVFQNTDDPNRLMVFFKKNGKVVSMANGFKIGGILIPAKYEKLTWIDTNDFLNEWLALVILLVISFITIPLIRLGVILIRRSKPEFLYGKLLPGIAFYSGLGFAVLSLIWIVFYFVAILKNPTELLFGMPPELIKYHFIPLLQVPLLILMIYSILKIFRNSTGTIVAKIYYLVFVFSSIFWLFILNRWHFIGFNY